MIHLDPIPLKQPPSALWIAGFILSAKNTNPALTSDSIVDDEEAHRMMPRGRQKLRKEIISGRNVEKGKRYAESKMEAAQ